MNKDGHVTSIHRDGNEPVDDRNLVEAAQRGDRDAFRTLFLRNHRRAYALALGIVRHPDDALDVVQDAFIKAYNYLDKFAGSSSFFTWMYRIVTNAAIDHLRKHRRVQSVPIDALRSVDGATEELLPAPIAGHPSRALMDKQIRGRIDAALDELSENHRTVLVMRELEGLSYDEMARAMGCSKGTIMSRLFHARKNMQRRLADLVDTRSFDDEASDVPGKPLMGDDSSEVERSRP